MGTIRGHQGRRKGTPVPPVEALASDLGKAKFLSALEKDPFCSTKSACQKAGIRVSDLPRLLAEDKDFSLAHDEIQAQYTASLEDTAHERATRDNTVLKWLLQSRNPAKYGGPTAATITVNVTPDQIKTMSVEELEDLQRKLRKS